MTDGNFCIMTLLVFVAVGAKLCVCCVVGDLESAPFIAVSTKTPKPCSASLFSFFCLFVCLFDSLANFMKNDGFLD